MTIQNCERLNVPLYGYHIADERAKTDSREGGRVFGLLRFLNRHLDTFLAWATSLQVCLNRPPVVPINYTGSIEVLK